jgi:hypothetical protein
MPSSTDRGGKQPPPVGGDDWMADYLRRASEYWRRAGDAASSTASKWGERSLNDDEWTVDTVTADLIEGWEEITPLLGEGIELWLELVQRSMTPGRGADG